MDIEIDLTAMDMFHHSVTTDSENPNAAVIYVQGTEIPKEPEEALRLRISFGLAIALQRDLTSWIQE